MMALLRPLFVGGLSIAIAATSLLASSSVALASTVSITTWSINAPVYEGDRPTVTATFTDTDLTAPHTVDMSWGDNTYDSYALAVGDRSFAVRKSVAYLIDSPNPLTVQITVSNLISSTSRFLGVTVLNAVPSVTSFGLSTSAPETGQAITANGTFTDPGVADTHTVTVDWGDLTPTTTSSLAAAVYTFTSAPHSYAAAGTYTVTATVTDDAGASATATSTVSVHAPNQAPSVVSFVVTAGTEGGSSTLALTFADPDPLDTHTVSVAWGDGSTSGPVLLAVSVTTFNASHVYADTGTYSVVLTLSDSASHTVTAGASVSPTNVAPVVGALSLSPSSVVDHQLLTVSGGFKDPGTADTFTVRLDWGDGTSSTQALAAGTRSFSDSHAYNAAGPVTIKATVTDRDQGASSSSVDLVVQPSNHAPANLTVAASPVVEGGTTTLTVSFTDAEALDTHLVSIAWGDGATETVSLGAGITTTSPTHTYANTGTYTVAVTVTDGGGLSVAGGTTVTATNVAPTLTSLVLSPSSVTDHQTLTVSGTFTDPGTADTFTVTVDWGDGTSSPQTLAAGVRTFSASHDYAAPGTYVVTATVTDRDGGSATQTASMAVSARNTAPSALALGTVVNGANLTVNGTFTDPDALDTHTVVLSWGDGTSETQALLAGVTTFSAAHLYSASATYVVTATVTDAAGASANATAQVAVTVPAVTASGVLDQMTALVQSFSLLPNNERWLLKKLDDLRASLAFGNGEVCSSTGTLSKILAFAQRTLATDEYAALSALGTNLQTAAGCTSPSSRGQPAKSTGLAPTTAPTIVAPTSGDRENEKTDKRDAEKQDKREIEETERGEAKRSGGHDSR